MARFIDVSLPLSAGTEVYAGDPEIKIKKVAQRTADCPYEVSKLSLGSHAGTHVDAPSHFIAGGKTAERLSLETLNGPALVIHVAREGAIRPEDVPGELLGSHQRILFATRLHGEISPRPRSYLLPETAILLVDSGVNLVGIDSMSVDPPESAAFPAHNILLPGNLIIVENLDLRQVAAGAYFLHCLPLRLVGADGAPARAVLRPLASRGGQ